MSQKEHDISSDMTTQCERLLNTPHSPPAHVYIDLVPVPRNSREGMAMVDMSSLMLFLYHVNVSIQVNVYLVAPPMNSHSGMATAEKSSLVILYHINTLNNALLLQYTNKC
ncbi:hypothetical protein E2C01_025555 [Portunus trituberculatus]|uniref:Uncharacterized protein n=1 Tax=Portunus trituberculatus TaxID=210409 RepID=A0A5B7EG13_PORTR|nr:hypothetical protein [Portunus trituberculatus]